MAIHEVPPQEYPDIVGSVPEEPQAAAFRPFIPASVQLPELTFLPLIVGTILGIIFGASSLYLVLKVGLTVSASIPVAVLSIAIFRGLRAVGLRGATILENNIVQTAGSAGESIAFGVGVTMPAIMILGFDLEITRVMLVAVLGGLLGILMMIPLRRALIVQQHGVLKYPEGTACAEVLKAGATDEERAIAARGAADGRGCPRRRGGDRLRRQGHLHRLRDRPRLPDDDEGLLPVEGDPREGLPASPSRPARSPPRSTPRCSASATSSAPASPRSCAPAACSPTWC